MCWDAYEEEGVVDCVVLGEERSVLLELEFEVLGLVQCEDDLLVEVVGEFALGGFTGQNASSYVSLRVEVGHRFQVVRLPIRVILALAELDVVHDDVVAWSESKDRTDARLNAFEEVRDTHKEGGEVVLHVFGVRQDEVVLEE